MMTQRLSIHRFAATVLLITLAHAAAADPRAWIGHVTPPWPPEMEHVGGSCIPDGDELCAYGITLLRKEESRWFFMGRALEDPTASDESKWQVLDAIPVPPVPADFELLWGTCRFNGREESNIVAIVRSDDTQQLLNEVIWARRADIDSGRFAVPPLAAVDCLNLKLGV